jgi:ribosomal protein S18 acetylase RimI-like enzyme
VEGSLTRAIAANHRAWIRRGAEEIGRFGGIDVIVSGRHGTLAFPRSRARLDEALRWARERGVRGMSCWSLHADQDLGVRLLARGFEWGWEPHWMALDLSRLPDEELAHPVVSDDGVHFVVRDRGHVAVYVWRGTAGIYDMWVKEPFRRRGIGRALTLAACRRARERGCTHATLNATPMGARVYRRVGFEFLGAGQTWWWHGTAPPSRRQSALVEAVGFGDLDALAELRPTRTEVEREIRGPGPPLAVAVVTGQSQAVDWILRRRPDLVDRPIEPRGGTVLHCAVEHGDPEMVEIALAHGADSTVRDNVWHSTPLGWAEQFGDERLIRLLAPERRQQ